MEVKKEVNSPFNSIIILPYFFTVTKYPHTKPDNLVWGIF